MNYSSAFTAGQISRGPNFAILNPVATTPANTWRFGYVNTPYPIPTHGPTNTVVSGFVYPGAIAYGDYFTFHSEIEAG